MENLSCITSNEVHENILLFNVKDGQGLNKYLPGSPPGL